MRENFHGFSCFVKKIIEARGKRWIPGIRNLWEYNENPKNPGSTVKILGIQSGTSAEFFFLGRLSAFDGRLS